MEKSWLELTTSAEFSDLERLASTLEATNKEGIYKLFMSDSSKFCFTYPATMDDHNFGMRLDNLALASAWTDLALAMLKKVRPEWHLHSLSYDGRWHATIGDWEPRPLAMNESFEGLGNWMGGNANDAGLAIVAALYRLLADEARSEGR